MWEGVTLMLNMYVSAVAAAPAAVTAILHLYL
jgi:hypothetical protein